MKKLLAQSAKHYFQLRSYRTDYWKRNAIKSQEFVLFQLVNQAQYTVFGKDHHFEDILNYKQFKESVPVSNYEEIFPYIERMRNGESDILWPGCIQFYSKSSGTTNDVSKYVPVSHDSLFKNHYRAGKEIYTFYLQQYPESQIFDNGGNILSLGGSLDAKDEYGIQTGDISAILMSQLPSWAQARRKPDIDVALMTDWKDKIPALIENTLGENITHIAGVPTWFVSIFKELHERYPQKSITEIWPQFELFIHGAVSFEPYRKLFKSILPDETRYLEVYSATEGFFAVQDDLSKQGEMLLLTDHGIFYEFIPMDTYKTSDQEIFDLNRVQIGVDYALIITTNAGLWRYDLGDTIQFTSIEPYRIKISGRTKQFINVFGEELMVGNAEAALAEVCEKYSAVIQDYTAGPIFMDSDGKGGHEWIIEFIQEPHSVGAFTSDLDAALRSYNSDYKAKRQDDIALQELVLHAVPEGTFETWLGSKGKLGGQYKVPRLVNTRKFLDEILAIAKKHQ